MPHPNVDQIRKNRIILLISRLMFISGLGLILYDYYLTYLTPYWNFQILLWMFIAGCSLVFLSFLGKFARRFSRKKGATRMGQCNGCGKCCSQPVRCVFLYKGKCMIHYRKPKQCRDFPSSPKHIVNYECGYWFE